jgi:DNA-directed RNA polymerase specialized sigma24 family protein
MTAYEREALTEEEGYELFRRAIAESDQTAWAAVYQRYRPMLVSWASRNNTTLQANEDYGDVADQAFERAWRAMTPSRFGQFPNLATVLAYLRTCVAAVLIDSSRARASRERAIQRLTPPESSSPEDLVLSRVQCDELWQVVSSAAESQQDRVVLLENFVYGVPPRLIVMQHPMLFDDVMAVYAAQRNLKARLQRNSELRRLWKEMTAE